MNTRTEKDSLGKVAIPKDTYYGTTTARALKNFQISNLKAPAVFRKSLGMIKLAAASSNHSLKLLSDKQFQAIEKACREFMEGKFATEFALDVFQAGAGTSYNMNCNEIIANRANEILGAPKGSYKFIHPNDHVNMAQSTNDVIPTALRLAALLLLPKFLHELTALEKELDKKAEKYRNLKKVGRTHLQDAVPITLGREFNAYKEALKKSREFIEERSRDLRILGIGGTAVGTGINTHPQYRKLIMKNLSRLVGIQFEAAKNLTETTNNMNSFLNFSAALRSLSTNLLNLVSDLKLMNSGPFAGLGEITLPAVQPGSSIMPGKVNPSIPECIEMICIQVIGNDRAIEIACQRSAFELNTNCPIIMHNLLQSIEILTNGLSTLRELCVKDLKVNERHIQEVYKNSLVEATLLAPKLGYAKTAEFVKRAMRKAP